MYEVESALLHYTKLFILSSMTDSALPVGSAQKRSLVQSDRLLGGIFRPLGERDEGVPRRPGGPPHLMS